MNREASLSPTSRQIARHLLTRDVSQPDPAMIGAALQRTCVRVSENLRDAMGEAGRNALIARALARTEADHPALKSIAGPGGDGIQLNGVAASVDKHGVAEVTAAIEGLFAAIVDLLVRLIGEDMAIRIIDTDVPKPRTSGGAKLP